MFNLLCVLFVKKLLKLLFNKWNKNTFLVICIPVSIIAGETLSNYEQMQFLN
jgi:hypothetical protein